MKGGFSMLECMNSMGKRIKEQKYSDFEDLTYTLFERIFANYLMFADDMKYIPLSEKDTKFLMDLEAEYSMCNSTDCLNMNEIELLTDSFEFYKAKGLVVKKDNNYYLNSEELKSFSTQYENYKNNISLTKRPN